MQPRNPSLLDFIARFWFPTALLLLLLVGLPGLVLFILNLCGMESAVNRWLESNLQFSYLIPIPWWGALILILVPLFILLLYFLKLKRKPLAVPSTFLWKKSVEDLHVNSLLQWLRQNVLLLLQILAVLAMIYAIMGPRLHGRQGEGRHYIIMIDNSASMSASDVSPSRLEWAKREALKEIDAARDQDYGMVIVFNSSAQTLQSRTNNRDLLRQAVRSIQPTNRPTRIDEALSLADSLANPSRSTDDAAVRPPGEQPGEARTYVPTEGTPTEVHLFTDGRFPDVPEFALGNLNLRFHSAGQAGPEKQNNVGIVTLNASRDESDPTRVHVFVVVLNTSTEEVSARVQLEVRTAGNPEPAYHEKPIRLPPRTKQQAADAKDADPDAAGFQPPTTATLTFELKDLDDRTDTVARARLLDVRDDFPLDNEAWVVLGVVRKARILIAGRGNDILDKFFNDALLKNVAVLVRLTPDELADEEKYLQPARNGDFDLAIFDRCGPRKEEDMPRGNTLFIGQPPPGWKRPGVETDDGKATEKVMNPHVKGWMARHALMRWLVALHEVGIGEAFRMKDLPPRTPLLMESELETPLLLTLNRGAFTDLVMTFPLLTDKDEWNTNWPLKPSFPLFLRNVLYTLGNVSDAAADELIQAGGVKLLRPDVGVAKIEVRSPSGAVQPLQRGARADFSFGGTDQLGVYQVSWNDQVQRSFAVNLLDREESNLQPRGTLRIGAEEIKLGEAKSQPRSLWKWIVLAALVLLLVEWYIYNRRVYI